MFCRLGVYWRSDLVSMIRHGHGHESGWIDGPSCSRTARVWEAVRAAEKAAEWVGAWAEEWAMAAEGNIHFPRHIKCSAIHAARTWQAGSDSNHGYSFASVMETRIVLALLSLVARAPQSGFWEYIFSTRGFISSAP